MKISAIIEGLGYSPKQVKLYLAALDMGESIITDIANRAGVPRTSAQSTIADMYRQGLVNYYLKHKRKYWTAADPKALMRGLKERETALQSIMPMLQAKQQSGGGKKSKTQFLKGKEAIQCILDDIIATKRHILCVMSFDHWRDMFSDEFSADFIRRRNQSFLRIRLLTPKTHASLALQRGDETQRRQTKFLPPHIRIKNPNFIYGSKVAIASLSKDEPMGIIMDDQDIADTMTWMFEGLWAQSSSD
jgi:sugar-specific transcriptional regulator TrmB